jgi:hypothetical protein
MFINRTQCMFASIGNDGFALNTRIQILVMMEGKYQSGSDQARA